MSAIRRETETSAASALCAAASRFLATRRELVLALDAQNEPMATADSWRGIWPATCVALAYWGPLADEWRCSRFQQQIVTFHFKVNTGSASRPQSLGLRS
jgi:hypothetical protein